MGIYHFIAIGGIGMSGLAEYLLENGHTVSGSDIEESKYTAKLKKAGARIFIGHSAENVPQNSTVVKSTVIRDNNPEVIRAKELGLKIYHRSDLLAEIAKDAQNSGKCFIGFSGTHGKTTTSGLASYVLEKAGLKPSFAVGGIVPEINTNAQYGSGKYFIAELDESDGTNVKYFPDILVVNNLEEDHPDFYKDGIKSLLKVFNQAAGQAKKVIINNDNTGTKLLDGDFITFGLNDADYTAKNIRCSETMTEFDVYHNKSILTSVKIRLAGIHNVYNTLAVIASLNEAEQNIGQTGIFEYLYDFTGMCRRFQKVCSLCGIEIYDDYAHHPTEIKTVLDAAAMKFAGKNIVAVFQPHRYTRLRTLWEGFKTSFKSADRIIVTDVYSASEDEIPGISGEAFARELEDAEYVSGSIKDVAEKLFPTLKSGDIVIGMGAGTITDLGKFLEKAGCVAS